MPAPAASIRAAGGPWSGLAARTGSPAPAVARPIYGGLARRLATRPVAEASSVDLWAGLARRVDFAQYRPRRIADVAEETLSEGGHSQTVLRSPSGGYLRLTPAERELWLAMDGSQSVAQLATAGFLRFKQLLPVADLVQNLRGLGFLADAPVGIYRGLRQREESRSVEGKGERLLDTLRSRTFAIEGIDGAVGQIYGWGGRLLFTRPFAALHALITLAGLISFARITSGGGAYQVLSADNVLLSLLGLWAALLLSFLLHELAHALAVKRAGRRVLRGGVMIYYGMPAAFVDTSDIWLAGQGARVLVSLAGPLSDLLLGSLAALAASAAPPGLLAAGAYKLAVACYLAALFNFNPLLELDGYFILVDLLRLPNLRRRALAFIGGPLWQKLRSRSRLSGEERFFGIYGLLAAAYTLLAIVLAGLFWQRQLVQVLGDLWGRGGPAGMLLAAAIVLAIVVPVGLGLIFAAWGLVRTAAAWAARRGYGRSPRIAAAALSLLALALAGLPLRHGLSLPTGLIAPTLWAIALAAQLSLQTAYRGARVSRALSSFLAVTVIELLALCGYLLLPALAAVWAAIEIVGFLLLMFAGFVALLDADLRQSRPGELAASAIMLGLAFLAGGLAVGLIQAAQPAAPFLWVLLQAAPIYCSVVAMALLLPQLTGLRDSRLLWCWLLLWLGIAAQTASYLLEVLPAWRNSPPAIAALVLSSGLWSAAWCTHYLTLRQLSARGLSWPLQTSMSEAERLRRAFQHCYAGCYRLLRELYGARRAQALDDKMDVLAATANWDITLDREQARVSPALAASPLDVQGARYAEVLRYTVATIEEQAGAAFARLAIRAAYDALPWPERESANRQIFPNTPWAPELSRAFGDVREARLRLLRQVELFATCDDRELHELAAALEHRRAAAGELLLAAGAAPQGLWLVEVGEVAVKLDGELLRELHRGDSFGEVGDEAAATIRQAYRATVESELLFLPAAELRRMLREAAPHTAEGIALREVVRLLERIPLFSGLPRAALRDLARQTARDALPARSVLVRQGTPSGRLFLIASGRAAVVRLGGEGPSGKARVIAQLGPEEFFGELELLRGEAPLASVVSVTQIELLAIPHAVIATMLAGAGGLAHGLEQIGSGRLIELNRGAP